MENFNQTITRRNRELGLRLCVGLDITAEAAMSAFNRKTPGYSNADVYVFGKEVIDATADVTCVYKPNLWFYLAGRCQAALDAIIDYAHQKDVPVIIDAKFGDIGSTSEQGAKYLFDMLQADAATVNPYLGADAIAPLLKRPEKGIIALCVTSNPGSAEFQKMPVHFGSTDTKQRHGRNDFDLFETVALTVKERWWTLHQNCGLVTGATHPEELASVRELVGPDVPLLIPGVGKQGGDLEAAVRAGVGADGQGVIMLNMSSGITGASKGKDFAEAAGRAAESSHNQINSALAG